MGSLSWWHWLIVLGVVLLIFGGGGKLTTIFSDLGKGLRSFKKNLEDNDTPTSSNDTSDTLDDKKLATSKHQNKQKNTKQSNLNKTLKK